MDSNGDTALSEAIVRFVAEKVGVRRSKVSEGTRLREDLGVDGDDAYDLLTAFIKEFRVRNENFDLADHFGPEGWGSFGLIGRLLPLTVQDLIDSAAAGEWHIRSKERPTSYLESGEYYEC